MYYYYALVYGQTLLLHPLFLSNIIGLLQVYLRASAFLEEIYPYNRTHQDLSGT